MSAICRTTTWLAAALAALGCLDPSAPPSGTYRFTPPAEYQVLWASVEACSGLRGEFARFHWLLVPGRVIRFGNENLNGVWKSPHSIYLTETAAVDSAGGYFTVRHEMLHDLIGHPGHPPVFATCHLLRF